MLSDEIDARRDEFDKPTNAYWSYLGGGRLRQTIFKISLFYDVINHYVTSSTSFM